MATRRFSRMRLRMVALAWVISESFSGSSAYAQPAGGVVASGAATISQQGSVTNVMQTTDRAVINWNNFSVPNGHTANFNMPSVNSAVLNRVTSLNNPSLINGAINSNGNVFLVNPSGVIVGATGVINTAGFTASALDIPNHEFMQGGNLHFRGDSKAAIINNGTINTGAGGVALVGHTVINTGTITSQGSISLVSGGSVKLSNGGTYTQADLATINNGISETAGLIKNTGTIRAVGAVASGGEVYLVNPNGKILHSGVIRATRETTVAATSTTPTTTKTVGGKVTVQAKTDKVELAGTIDVSGAKGGNVVVTGNEVQLASATIDASGESAGGTVNIGGGYQGKDTAIQNALATSVDAASTISVNAATGNAGTVIVWSDQATSMAGTITAQSTVSGDGGFVEVSGKEQLEFTGTTNLLAANGKNGTLLIDPATFTVNSGNVVSLRNSWGSGDLIIQASTTININSALYPTISGSEIIEGTSNTLRLQDETGSGNNVNININAAIRNGNGTEGYGSLYINAGGGALTVASTGSVTNPNGYTSITAGTISLSGPITTNSTLAVNAGTNSVAIGTAASGTFDLTDAEIGLLTTGNGYVSFSGGTFNVNMSGSEALNSTGISGTSVTLTNYTGQSLEIYSPSLAINGPVNGSGRFVYDQGSSRSLHLGTSTTGNVILDQTELNRLSGFYSVEFGTYSTGSPLVVNNANLSQFNSVSLYGSSITISQLSIGSDLTLSTDTLTVSNAISKTSNSGRLDISTGNRTVGIGDGTSGNIVLTQTTLTNLGTYSNLEVRTDANMTVNANLTAFNSSVRLRSNVMTIAGLSVSGNLYMNMNNPSITGTIVDTTPGSQIYFSYADYVDNQGFTLGDSPNNTWRLTTAELNRISGFGNFQFASHSESTLTVDADLTGVLTSTGSTSLTAGNIVVTALTVPNNLNIYADTLAVNGNITSLTASSTFQLGASSSATTVRLGTGSGTLSITQTELNRLVGFQNMNVFGYAGINVSTVTLPMNLNLFAYNSTDIGISNLTLNNNNSGNASSLYLQGRNITGSGIALGGSLQVQAQQNIGSSASSRFAFNHLNSTSNVGLYSSSTGNIFVSVTNAGTGPIDSTTQNGSINITAAGDVIFGQIRARNPATTGNPPVPVTPTASVTLATTANGKLQLNSTVTSPTTITLNSAGAIIDNYSGNSAPLIAPGTIQLTAVGNIQNLAGSYFDVVSNSAINATTTGLDSNIRLQANGTLKLGTISTNSGIVFANAYGGSSALLDSPGTISTGGADLRSTGKITLKTLNANGTENVLFSATDDITILANTVTITGGGNTTLRSMSDIILYGSVVNNAAAGRSINLIAGWDGTTLGADDFDMTPFLAADVNTTGIYGRNNGSIFIGDGTQAVGVAVGSRSGPTQVFGHDLNVLGSNATNTAYAQLGFQVANQGAGYNVTGTITANLKNNITVQAGTRTNAYAQIGHGGVETGTGTVVEATISAPITIKAGATILMQDSSTTTAQIGHGGSKTYGSFSGDITIAQAKTFSLINGTTNSIYSQLGHGGFDSSGNRQGNISVTVSEDLTLNSTNGGGLGIGHFQNKTTSNVNGNILLAVGRTATLTRSTIGHFGNSSTTPNNTTIGVGLNAPATPGSGKLIADSNSDIRSSSNGQLRFYLPDHADFQVANYASLNSAPAGVPNSASLRNLQGFATFGTGGYATVPGEGNFGIYLDPTTYLIRVGGTGSSIYGTAPGAFNFTLVSGVLAPGDTDVNLLGLVVSGFNVTANSGAGGPINFQIIAGASTDSRYVIDPSSVYQWTVNPAPLTVTINDIYKTYGDVIDVNSSAVVSGYKFAADEGSATKNFTSLGAAGTASVAGGPYAITGTLDTSANANYYYDVTNSTFGTVTVTPAPITLKAVSIDLQYGAGFNFSGTQFSQTGGAFYNGDTLASVTMGADAFGGGNLPATANVGAYTISIVPGSQVFSSGSASNYAFTLNTGVFNVTPAPITLTAVSIGLTYGAGFNFSGTQFSQTGGTFYNGDTLASVTMGADAFGGGNLPVTANVGAYTISIVPGSEVFSTGLASNYAFTYNPGVFTVNAAPLTVSIPNITKTYGSVIDVNSSAVVSGYVFPADVGSATPNFTSVGEASTANVVGGPYAITGSLLTNSNYYYDSVNSSIGQVTVTPAPITLRAVSFGLTYGAGFNFTGTQFATVGGTYHNGDTLASVTMGADDYGGGNLPFNAPVGPYGVTIVPGSEVFSTGLASNYSFSYQPGIITVSPAALTITANNQSKIYGDSLNLTALGNTQGPAPTGGFAVSGLVSGDSVSSVTLAADGAPFTGDQAQANVGSYTITASAAQGTGLANYTITYNDGTLTVTPRDITVTALGGSSTYGQNPANPGLSATNLASFDTVAALTGLSNSFGIDQYTNAGPHTLTVQGTLTNPNYNVTQTTNGTWVVNQAALTVTANSFSKTYGDTYTFNGTEYSQVGLQNGETINVTLSSTGAVNTAGVAGNPYAITVDSVTGGTANLSNYDLQSSVNGTLTVTPRGISVFPVGGTSTYGQNPANPGLSATNLASFDAADPNGTLTGLSNSFGIDQYTNAGSHSIRVIGTLTNPNYIQLNPDDDYGTWIVNPAALTITANNRTKTYGQNLNLGTTQFTAVGLQNMETIGSVTLTSAGAAGSATVAGNPYAITTSNATGGTFNANNYDITYSSAGELTVNKANLTVRANNRSKTYGDNLNLGTTAFTRTGTLFNGDTLTNVTLVASGTPAGNLAAADAGTYSITPSNAVGSGLDNYNITYVNGTLNVGRANLFITPTSQTKVYGDLFTFTGTEFSAAGLKNGDTIASVTLVSAGTPQTANAGFYNITASNAVGGTYKASNYNTFYIPNFFGFTVTRAPLTVDIDNATKVYGDVKTFTGTEFSVTGLKNADTLTNVTLLSLGQPAIAPVGDYAIIGTVPVQGNINLLNYNITVNPGTLSVTPAPLTVTATAQTKIYGNTFTFTGNIPEFTAIGLKNGQNVTSVTIGSAGAAAGATVGNYEIDISNAQGFGFNPNNYSITYVKGNFEVTQRSLVITANDQNKIFGTNHNLGTTAFTLGTGANQGLVNGDTVTGVTLTSAGTPAAAPVGPYPIVASNAVGSGLSNYAITYQDGTLFVGQANLVLVANNQYKTFGWTGFLNGVTGYTAFGLQNGDTIGSVSLSSAATPNTAPIGFYPINISNPTGGTANLSNYSITLVPGIFVVGSNFGNYYYDLNDQGQYYWQTLPSLYGNVGSSSGINYSPAGQTTGDKPITETNSYDVFGGEQ